MKKFEASVPRKMFWSTDVGGTDFCPQCHGRLENESHSYLLVVREPGDFQPFIVGNDDGYFCARCPIVVLDHEAFAESAFVGNPSSRSFEFTVIGIVDLNAIPKEKADVPIGDDDNPIPLVEFTNIHNKRLSKRRRSKVTKDKRRKSHRKNKRRSNLKHSGKSLRTG